MSTTSPSPTPEETRNKLILWMSEMSEDEVRVAFLFISKFMGEGRKEYGPLDLRSEKRSLMKIMSEGADEVADGLFYIFVKMLIQMDQYEWAKSIQAEDVTPDPGGLY